MCCFLWIFLLFCFHQVDGQASRYCGGDFNPCPGSTVWFCISDYCQPHPCRNNGQCVHGQVCSQEPVKTCVYPVVHNIEEGSEFRFQFKEPGIPGNYSEIRWYKGNRSNPDAIAAIRHKFTNHKTEYYNDYCSDKSPCPTSDRVHLNTYNGDLTIFKVTFADEGFYYYNFGDIVFDLTSDSVIDPGYKYEYKFNVYVTEGTNNGGLIAGCVIGGLVLVGLVVVAVCVCKKYQVDLLFNLKIRSKSKSGSGSRSKSAAAADKDHQDMEAYDYAVTDDINVWSINNNKTIGSRNNNKTIGSRNNNNNNNGYLEPVDRTRRTGNGYLEPVDRTRRTGNGYLEPVDRTRRTGNGYLESVDRTRRTGNGYLEPVYRVSSSVYAEIPDSALDRPGDAGYMNPAVSTYEEVQ